MTEIMTPVKWIICLMIAAALASGIPWRAQALASDTAQRGSGTAVPSDKDAEKTVRPAPILVIAGTSGKQTSKASHPEPPPDPATLLWAADDCGCTPIQPDRKSGTAKITYGFYHHDMAPETDEENGTATARIKYSSLNRIGFYAMGWDDGGRPFISEYWANNTFVKNARRYNSRVDLVVVVPKDPAAILGHPAGTGPIIREIRRRIKHFDSTGITLDLRESGLPEDDLFFGFVGALAKALKRLGKGRYLNLFLTFEQMEKESPAAALNRMHRMSGKVDLFLVKIRTVPGSKAGGDQGNDFLVLSDKLDNYDLARFAPGQSGLKQKIIPVLDGGDPRNEATFSQILSVGFGGVGLWPETALSGDATQFIADVFHRHRDQLPLDPVKRFVLDHFPGLCHAVCPNRTWVIWITAAFGALLFLYFLLSFFICRLKAIARSHALYFICAILGFMAMTASLILCVPRLQGWRTEALILLTACGAVYTAAGYIKRRREAGYP